MIEVRKESCMWNMFNNNYKAVCTEWGEKSGLETLVIVVDQKEEPGTL